MSNLTVANVQKCLEVIRQFVNTDFSSKSPEQFKDAQKNVNLALDHLEKIFDATPGYIDPELVDKCINCGYNIQATD